MTKEDKELLLKDLSGRLLYDIIIKVYDTEQGSFDSFVKSIGNNIIETEPTKELNYNPYVYYKLTDCKPYLRLMSSMTSKECMELSNLLPRYFTVFPEKLFCTEQINGGIINPEVLDTIIDFYNSHHLDWRGLIPKGLALEASKDMYKF